MTTTARVIAAPLERIGGLLERRIVDEPSWSLGPIERELGQIEARLGAIDRLRPRIHGLRPGPARSTGLARLTAEEDAARRRLDAGLEALAELTARVHLAQLTGEDPAALAGQLRLLAGDIDAATELQNIGNAGARSA